MRFGILAGAALALSSPVQAATIVQTRSLFDVLSFSAFDSALGTLNSGAISAEQIANLLNTAGFGVGIGEWRPEKNGSYGRFHVASTEEARS